MVISLILHLVLLSVCEV